MKAISLFSCSRRRPRRQIRIGLFRLALLAGLAASPAAAFPGCAVGDICELTFPLFGCKDANLLKDWVDLYVDQSRDMAEHWLTAQEEAGRCARFVKGDKLRIIRYIGMSRLEASRPGDATIYTVLLK